MKRASGSIIAVLLMTLAASGCSLFMKEEEDDGIMSIQAPSETESYSVPDNFLGEWVDIKTGETRYINISGQFTLSRVSDRVVTDGSGALLYPVRIANAKFSGTIAGFDQTSRSALTASNRAVAGGKGWIKVVLEDLDSGQITSTTTDQDGNFTAEGAIPEDDYQVTPEGAIPGDEVTPEGGTPTVVTPMTDGDNVGTITVVDRGEGNFKASIEDFARSRIFYAGESYFFWIIVKNTGTVDMTAVTCKLTMDSGLSLESGKAEQLLGTIEPGGSRNIPIDMKCSKSSIPDYSALKTIGVQINDQINQRTWNDSVSLRFYREPVYMIVATPGRTINGVLVTPDGKARRFSTDGRVASTIGTYGMAIVKLPGVLSGNYMLVFCGADANTETPYFVRFITDKFNPGSIEADTYTVDPWGGGGTGLFYGDYLGPENHRALIDFMDVARYEPNDTEQTATAPGGDSFFGYLHKNDFDYYKFRLRH
jgi:hypothetical protein